MCGFRGIEIIDPDAIAREMPSRSAGRESLCRRIRALGAGRSHLVETTFAGTGILRLVEAAHRRSFWTILHWVSLGSADRTLDRASGAGLRLGVTKFQMQTGDADFGGHIPTCRWWPYWLTKS